jgi:hypothetical protein
MNERLSAGDVIRGRYKVVDVLGEGGMGAVYLVDDEHLPGKQWAMKEMCLRRSGLVREDTAVRLFEEEARILAGCSHPHLPQVSDFFSDGEKWYLVMERIKGRTLREVLEERRGPLPEEEAVLIALQILDALEYLHTRPRPVVFRDLKPANIMVTPERKAVLIDFGIARFFDPEKKTDTLKMGSTGYAPPEQYRGRGTTDGRSDIYSLGATLHHLLTGRDPQDEPPFSFPPPRSLNPAISPHIEKTVLKALEYDRGKRYPTARAMAGDIAGGKDLLWEIPQMRGLLSRPGASRFFAPLSAQKDRVVLLAVLLAILTVLLIVNIFRAAREREAYRRSSEAAVHLTRAAAWREQGRYREEAGEYEKAVALRQDDAVVWFHLGMVRIRLKDPQGARSALERAVSLNDRMGAAHRELALIAARGGRFSDALKYIEKIQTSDPEFAAMQLLRARVLDASGKKEEARKAYIRFSHLAPDEKERARIEKSVPSVDSLR